jgi:hypothetical protein
MTKILRNLSELNTPEQKEDFPIELLVFSKDILEMNIMQYRNILLPKNR